MTFDFQPAPKSVTYLLTQNCYLWPDTQTTFGDFRLSTFTYIPPPSPVKYARLFHGARQLGFHDVYIRNFGSFALICIFTVKYI